jgi:hypothetical protein
LEKPLIERRTAGQLAQPYSCSSASRPNWFSLSLIYWSQYPVQPRLPLNAQLPLSQLFSPAFPIPWGTSLSKVLRGTSVVIKPEH